MYPNGVKNWLMFPVVTVNFSIWLQSELDRRGITARDLSQTMGSSPATIYRILSGERGVGREVAGKIARALKLPDTVVLYQAGFMERNPNDPAQDLDPTALDILRLLENRTESEQTAALAALTALFEAFDRGKSDNPRADRKVTARSPGR